MPLKSIERKLAKNLLDLEFKCMDELMRHKNYSKTHQFQLVKKINWFISQEESTTISINLKKI